MVTKAALLFYIFLGASAFAGEGTSVRGGGDIVICETQLGEKQKSIFLSDLIGSELALDTYYFQDFSPEFAETAILHYLDLYHKADARAVRSALSSLKFIPVDEALPELNTQPNLMRQNFAKPDAYQLLMLGNIQVDTGYIPFVICDKKQLAVQDFVRHEVRVNAQALHRLSNFEQAFLKIHEAYLKIAQRRFKTLTRMEKFTRAKMLSIWLDFKHLKLAFRPQGSPLGNVGAQMIAINCSHDLFLHPAAAGPLRLNQSEVNVCVEDQLKLTGFSSCPGNLSSLPFDPELPSINTTQIAALISLCHD